VHPVLAQLADLLCYLHTPCPEKSLQFTVHNFNKFKYIFIILAGITLILHKRIKFTQKIYVSQIVADVIITSLKMPLSAEGSI